MKKLSELFHLCAYDIHYEQTGHDVNYAFLEDGETLYIFFEGSGSTTDWIRNFLFRKKPYKDMEIPYYVHRGFLAAWKEVEDVIINKISNPAYKQIVTVGYSHGGALAGLCHECVWYWRPDIRENIWGFGFEGPRFYAGFRVKKQLKERWEQFYLIRDNQDIVTHCPPRLFGYCHVGSIVKIHGNKKLVDKWYLPGCIKSHYPQVVYDGLVKEENKDRK